MTFRYDNPECVGQPQYFQHIGPRRTIVRIESIGESA